MQRIELFRALLDKKFYNNYSDRLSADMFPDQLQDLYEALVHAHRLSNAELYPADVWEAYKLLNPTSTASQKNAVYEVINAVKDCEDLSPEIAREAFNRILVEDKATRIARAALEISQGKHEDWSKLETILKEDVTKETVEYVTTNLEDLSKDISATYKWRFNLVELNNKVGPIGPEVFVVLAGNVNSGKSLAAISFVFGPEGFLEQGAKVLYVGNEESLKRTMMRGASCYTGLTRQEIIKNPQEVQKTFDNITKSCYLLDDVTMNFARLNALANRLKPDVIVLDMLDNIVVKGDFQRGDEKLGRIYQSARELAKKHSCAVIGLSQTSADATGKLYVGFDKLAGSKVDKAAAADLILILGKLNEEFSTNNDSNYRQINVAKSKLEGNGEKIGCKIIPLLSRLVA